MNNPNILFTAPGRAELIEKPMPMPAEDEVLVEIAVTTVSAGTERANLIGDPNVNYTKDPNVSFPRQCGYSAAGTVIAVGSQVTSLHVGDRVACAHTVHAKFCKVKETNAFLLPDSVSFSEAALVYIATFPLAAIRKCRLEVGESAIVMGLGILGLMAVELLRAAGAVPIIAVDPVEQKREQALALGADYALDPFAPEFEARIKEITGKGVNVAVEVTGKGQGLDMVLDCMKKFGRVALLGCTRNSDFSIDYYRKVHGPGITLVGAHTNARPKIDSSEGWWTEREDALCLIRMMERGRLDLGRLVEETHSPSHAPQVFDRLAKSPSFPVVQFDWRSLS